MTPGMRTSIVLFAAISEVLLIPTALYFYRRKAGAWYRIYNAVGYTPDAYQGATILRTFVANILRTFVAAGGQPSRIAWRNADAAS